MLNFLVFLLRKKYMLLLYVNFEVVIRVKEKDLFLTFSPPISNFIALPFQNSFRFGPSSYQKK